MLNFRLGDLNDFDEILLMCRDFWGHTQFSEEFDRDHTLKMVEMALSHKLLAVAELNGNIVGFVAGIQSYLLASTNAKCGTELAFWINPEHRGGKNGVALLQFMEGLVKEQGIKYWTMVSMQSSMPEQVGKMYERMGYVHSETCYTKVFDYGGDNYRGGSRRG